MKKEISIAPMLDWTDNFFRSFMRQITHHSLLYTEMITEQALVHGDKDRLLFFDDIQQPLALQIGGNTPEIMAQLSKIAEDKGFCEININAGCPSERVQSGSFGACLMKTPDIVADCVHQMKNAVTIPVSIKTRIAIDDGTDDTGYEKLHQFVKKTSDAGASKFIIHARKARLKNFTPKENRTKLSLNYPVVYQIKKDFPNLQIIINGGIKSVPDIREHLGQTDGAMIGTHAYANPYFLSEIDKEFYGDNHPILSRFDILENLMPLIENHIQKGGKLISVGRHLMGLFYGQPNSRLFKQVVMSNDIDTLKSFMHQFGNK